jgi:hypothetical protein
MLSYGLDLRRDQLAFEPSLTGRSPRSLVVFVDDCALSGARFAHLLAASPAERVVLASLVSPPGLRRAVEAEERVVACVSGGDLAEREQPGEAGADAWRERLPNRRFWLGSAEPVVFPWSEPESVWWNARDGRVEDGWRRASPRLTLRGRSALGLPPDAAEGHAGGERFDLAPGAFWKLEPAGEVDGDGEEGRLKIRAPDDRLYGFEGTALEIWKALLAGGDRAAAAGRLTALYRVEEAAALRDVDELVDDLLYRGVLVRLGRTAGPGAACPPPQGG